MTLDDVADLSAAFSCDAGVPAAIYISAVGSPRPIASTHLSAGDDPIRALRAMGYRLAYPFQNHGFRDTMAATGYQHVRVVAL